MTAPRAADRWLGYVPPLAVLAVIGQTVVQVLNLTVLDRGIALIEVDSDDSLWAFLSSALMAIAAGAIGVIGMLQPGRRASLLVLAAILGFLAADDILAIHERITVEELGPIPHPSRVVWILAFAPMLAVALVLLRGWSAALVPAARRWLRAGLAALALALGMEFLSPVLFAAGIEKGTLLYDLEVLVEEGLELVGTALLAGVAIAALLRLPGDAPGPARAGGPDGPATDPSRAADAGR